MYRWTRVSALGIAKRSLNHMKDRATQKYETNPKVAQPPSAVVIYYSLKGCPNFCPFPFTFLLFVQTNPISKSFLSR
jgi:hypothetical protein